MTDDSIESMFQVNHLGHFSLTKLLDDRLSAGDARIVMIYSNGHYNAIPGVGVYTSLKEPNDQENWDGLAYYGMSKLANVLFAQEMSLRLNSQPGRVAHVNACHPGAVCLLFLSQ